MAAGFKQATVNASDVPSTQTNFPAYVDLSRLGITTLAEAQSVRVYADSAKTTEWAREIVSATEMHVRVPSLTSTVTMFVDYDGVRADYAVTDTFGRNAVWSDYRQLYHLSNNSDSTAAGIDLTTSFGTPTYAAAKVGNGLDGGSNNTGTLITRNNSNWDGNQLSSGVIFSFLVYLYDYNPTLEWFWGTVSSGGTRWNTRFRKDSPSTVLAQYDGVFPSSTGWTAGVWYHVVLQKEGSNVRMYRNAAQVASIAYSGGGTTTAGAQTTMLDESGGTVNTPADVILDEVRIRYGSFTTNWITTESNNLLDEPGFWGTWTDVGGGGGGATPSPLLAMSINA